MLLISITMRCPFKTAQVVDRILRTKYAVSRDGLPGNDDSGCMSSWFVFSSMGFYPLAGQDIYLLGKPLFDRTDILLPSGKNFSILGRNLSKDNIYVQAVKLNGQDYDKSYISHSMILEGGILEFYMGNTPSEWGTVWKS